MSFFFNGFPFGMGGDDFGFGGGRAREEPSEPKEVNNTRFYEVLGVSKTATYDEIRKAYRKQAKVKHPDKGGSEEAFQELQQAYEVLSDPNKKGIYDIYGYEGLSNGILTPAGELKGCYKYSGNGLEIFEKFMGTANPFALIRDAERNSDDWGSAFFSAYGGKNAKPRKKEEPIVVDLECTLEELYNGTIKKISYERYVLNYDMRTTQKVTSELDVEIFPGYDSKTELTFSRMGNECAGEEASDLIVKIKEKKHKEFKRVNGKDLIYIKTLTLAQALSSEPVRFTTLDNRKLAISMDEIIAPQTVKVIKGEGMPIYTKEVNVNDMSVKKGDLFIKFDIKFPEYINPMKKEQIIKLLESNEE